MTEAAGSGAPRRRPTSREFLLAAVVLLAATLVLPLWSTRMEAPQYRNEEALRVAVYAGRVKGDVSEIETLNQYVGVSLPLDTPELHATPWILGGLLVATLLVGFLPSRSRIPASLLLALAMLGAALAGGALLQYRLYEMGHVRTPTILEGVPDFTPPILGSAKIANFTVHMSLGAGGWCYGLALLSVVMAFLRARGEKLQSIPTARASEDDSRAETPGAPAGLHRSQG